MKHMHYTGSAPTNANRSKAFFTIKPSRGLRILHVLCSYWKAYFAGNLYYYGKKRDTTLCGIASATHTFLVEGEKEPSPANSHFNIE